MRLWQKATPYKVMGHGRGKSCRSVEKAPAKVADYNVTGELTPDGTCNYFYGGEYNDKPYYRRQDSAYFIWWNGIDTWNITVELGVLGAGLWYRTDPNIVGEYIATGAFHGTATVAAGPH